MLDEFFSNDWLGTDIYIPFDRKERNQLLRSLQAAFFDLRVNKPEYALNKAKLQEWVRAIRDWNQMVAEDAKKQRAAQSA